MSLGDVLPVCKDYMDLATIWSLSITCQDFNKYVPYVNSPTQTVQHCVACNTKVKDPHTPCIYHSGISKTWTTNWEDADGLKFSGYTIKTCCREEKGCATKPTHSVTMVRCTLCGEVFNPLKVASSGKCAYHPSEGADMYGRWMCCGSGSSKAPGCKMNDHHTAGPTRQKVQTVVWSRKGTKVLVRTNDENNVFSYNKDKQLWIQKYCIVGAYVMQGGKINDTDYPESNTDCAFSPNGCFLLFRKSSKLLLFDLKNGTTSEMISSDGIYGFSWGEDGKFLYYFATTGFDRDYGPIAFFAYDFQAKKTLPFVHFTHSNPMGPTLDDGYLRPLSTGAVSFRHPDLSYFIRSWLDGGIVFEPYGNRILFFSKSGRMGVLYKSGMVGKKLQLEVMGSCPNVFTGMGLGVRSLEWVKDGFIALVEQNFKGRVYYSHHQYEVWRYNNKLERVSQVKMPEAACSPSKAFSEDQLTLFRYSPAHKCYFYAQHSKFFVLDEQLQIIHTFPWANEEYRSYTYFHPNVGVAIYTTEGLLARVPLPPYKEPPQVPTLSYFTDQCFLTAPCSIVSPK